MNNNKVRSSLVNPLTQPGNPNGDILRLDLTQYYYMGQWTFGLNGQYLRRDANEFVPSLIEFVPAKRKWQIEGIASYEPWPNVRVDGRVARIWTHQDATADWVFPIPTPPFPGTGIPEVSQDAWAFTLGGMILFDPKGVVGAGKVRR